MLLRFNLMFLGFFIVFFFFDFILFFFCERKKKLVKTLDKVGPIIELR